MIIPMVPVDKSDNKPESYKKSVRSLSIVSYLTGLAAMSFSITLAIWTYLSVSVGAVMPPLLSRRSTLLFFLGMFVLSLQCGIAAWASGLIASRRAGSNKTRGYRRWRMGIYLGIFAIVLLAITFVVLASYSIHLLMNQTHFNNRYM